MSDYRQFDGTPERMNANHPYRQFIRDSKYFDYQREHDEDALVGARLRKLRPELHQQYLAELLP